VQDSDLIPPERLAEAGVWIARLHGDERGPNLEAGVRQWLEASPLNAQAFELATEVWDESQNLRRVVPLAVDVPVAPRRGPRFYLAVGAAVVAVVLIAALVGYQFPAGVATGVGEQRMLTLSDGTRVYMNTATRIVVRYEKDARRIELKSGEALFAVAKRADWPFIVKVGDQQVRALGTSFVVRREDRRLTVTLVEGKVTVASTEGEKTGGSSTAEKPFTLTSGQRLVFTPGRRALLDTPSLEKATAWRRGQVVLDDTPLGTAAAEMNRYSPLTLVIERREAAELLVSGLFQAGDTYSFARAVAEAHGLTVAEEGERIVLAGVPTHQTSGQREASITPLR